MPRRSLLALALLLAAAPAAAQDDEGGLGNLLDSIPDIETQEDEAAKKAAEEAAKETANDPLAEEGFDQYTRRVRDHVLAQFEPPKSVVKKAPDTRSRILLKLYGDGSYMSIGQVQASGDKKFEKAVLKAIQAAEPVPKPPVSLRNAAAQGILVDFAAK